LRSSNRHGADSAYRPSRLSLLWGAGLLMLAGCATQAALVDVQTDLEVLRGQADQIAQRLAVAEKALQDRSSAGQRGQVDLVVRLDELAADIRKVQGGLEEQAHTLSEVAKSGDDQSYRFTQLSARLDTLDAHVTEQERRASGQPAGAPPGPSAEGPPASDQERVVLPGRTPRGGLSPVEAYNLAYNDYVKGSYELAIQGFVGFLQQYPTSILVPHALYWLGESYYQTKQYPQALEQYNRLITQYPKNEKLAGTLLKQGFAYAAMGDKTKARGALKRVLEAFPNASEANLAKDKLAELR
jgi:tol-pal system protein YbgF